MAQIIHPKLMQNAALAFFGCNQDLHVLSRNYEVLRESTVPSILIESCMLTNQCQQNKIASDGNQGIVTDGIAAGVSFAISPGGPAPQYRPTAAVAPVLTQVQGLRMAVGVRPSSAQQVQSASEGFEGATFPPAGWTTTTLGGPAAYTWQRTTDTLYVHAGVGAALVGGESPGAIDEWLISPMTLLGVSDRAVSFYWSANRYFASSVNAECLVRPAGTSTWTRVWQLLDEPSGGEWEWKQRVASLVPWIGDSVQVAFRASGTNGGDVNIDDFAIGNFTPTAPPANDLCANATALPAGNFSLSGTTLYAANDADPARPDSTACSVEPISSGDVFYSFNATTGDTLSANVSANWPAVVYVVDGCDSSTAHCLVMAGQYEPISQDGTGFTYVFGSTGQYYLVVDGMDGESGAFQLSGRLHGATTEVAELIPPGQLSLLASPNPSVRAVTFSGTVPDAVKGPAQVHIVDVAGRMVAIIETPIVAGSFQVVWDGQDTAGHRARAGVYFATLQASGHRLSRTVVLAP